MSMYASKSLQYEINNLFQNHLNQYADEWAKYPEDHLRLKDAHRHLEKLYIRFMNMSQPLLQESIELGLMLIEAEVDFDEVESKLREMEIKIEECAA